MMFVLAEEDKEENEQECEPQNAKQKMKKCFSLYPCQEESFS